MLSYFIGAPDGIIEMDARSVFEDLAAKIRALGMAVSDLSYAEKHGAEYMVSEGQMLGGVIADYARLLEEATTRTSFKKRTLAEHAGQARVQSEASDSQPDCEP